jgi:hypothetical protein
MSAQKPEEGTYPIVRASSEMKTDVQSYRSKMTSRKMRMMMSMQMMVR